MSETAKERAEKLLGMSKGELVMHAQDLTQQRDELLALVEVAFASKCNLGAGWSLRAHDAIASVKGGAA